MLIKTILELLTENKITVDQAESMINEVISLRNNQKDYTYPINPYIPTYTNQQMFGNTTVDDFNTSTSQLELFDEEVKVKNICETAHIRYVEPNGDIKLPDGRIISKHEKEYVYKGETFKNPIYIN